MSGAAIKALRLGRQLSTATGVHVELFHDGGPRWYVRWVDGPTREQMRERVAAALSGPQFAEMRNCHLWYDRGRTARAWACQAIAARREGSLARDLEASASYRHRVEEHLSPDEDGLTSEDYVMLASVDLRIDGTAYPDRASVPEDEPLIEQLLAGSEGDEAAMMGILRNADRAPVSPADGPRLRAVDPETGEPR